MVFMHQDANVQAYVAGDLAPKRVQVMEAHLSRCAECRDLVAETRRNERRRQTRAESGEPPVDTGSTVMVGTRRRMVSNAVPVIGSIVTVVAFVAVLLAAWNAGGSDAGTVGGPAEEFSANGQPLSGFQVAELRRKGWSCPDLRTMGLDMTSSIGFRQGDVGSVTLTYSGKGSAVVLSETRNLGSNGADAAQVPSSAASPAPGEPGGSETSAQSGASAGSGAAASPLATGTSVTIEAGGAQYVVHSSLSQEETAVLVARVKEIAEDRQEDIQAAEVGGWDRLSRGFARLVDPTR